MVSCSDDVGVWQGVGRPDNRRNKSQDIMQHFAADDTGILFIQVIDPSRALYI